MPLTVSFSVNQLNTSPSVIVFTDTSTGTDAAVTKKRIYLQLADGSYLVPSGTSTDYIETTEASLNLDVLSEDKAVNVTVQWLDVSDTVLYTLSGLYCFSLYAKQYLFDLTKAQAANPYLMKDADFWANKVALFGMIESAENAIEIGADIYAAQLLLDKASTYINNEILFY